MRRHIFAVASLTVVLAWTAAIAQPVLTQSGRALDANPSTIYGRANEGVVNPMMVNRGQLLMTGEIGAGRSFQGAVPYNSPRQFQGLLGSATLYDFNRDSIGLWQVRQGYGAYGTTYATAPVYQYNERTVVRAADVTGSMGAIGATPATLNPFAQPAYVTAAPPPRSIANAAFGLEAYGAYLTPTASGLSAEDLITLRRQNLGDLETWWRNFVAESASTRAISGSVTTPVNLPMPGGTPSPRATWTSQLQEQQWALQANANLLADPTAGRAEERVEPTRVIAPAKALPTAPAPKGADVYSDLLQQADQMGRSVAGKIQAKARADQNEPLPTKSPYDLEPLPGTEKPAPDAMVPTLPPPPTRQEILDLGATYESFASRRTDAANSAMRRAENLIKQGQFYKALDELHVAQQWDPANPLVLLRISHARFGAGEYYTAALYLRRAMGVFAPVASIHTNLADQLNAGSDNFGRRMAELEQLAQHDRDPQLWMLLCYLDHATGRLPEAQKAASQVIGLMPGQPDDLAVRLARMILRNAGPTTAPDAN